MMLKKLVLKLKNIFYASRCAFVLLWRSIAIMIQVKLKPSQKTNIINRHARTGARAILDILKADYQLICDYPLENKENGHYIFMSNHQSLLDLPLIFATLPGTIRLIAKKELFDIPIFGKVLTLADCIAIDRANPTGSLDFFAYAKKKLNEGLSYWIFPEGTRSHTGMLLPLKTGGFRLARETGAKIIPVGIIGTRQILPAGKLQFSLHQPIKIRIGKPIDTCQYDTIDMQKKLVSDVSAAILQLIRQGK